ncbi:PTS system mannose/fructose/N-acetylgalactosamine-transporter subunit IIB [Faecalicatena orotica]|uniref:PTS system mannose/fructose/N-acetylgalactosamine-transporter subunit IIB n=1 Tax=Faecalicatena orotica TaxID=1544 RepID=UPI0032179BBB
MGIELLRIDERLIHGQILLGWAEEMDCTSIMIVDDATVSDPVMKSIMEMSFPENYKCSICSVSQVEKEKQRLPKERLLVVVKSISTAFELMELGIRIPRINMGNMTFRTGKKKFAQWVYLSPEEIGKLARISEHAETFYQAVPDSERIDAKVLLAGGNKNG